MGSISVVTGILKKYPQLKNSTAVIYHVGNSAAVKVPWYGPPHDYTSHIIPRPSVNKEPGTWFLEGFGDTSKANIEGP